MASGNSNNDGMVMSVNEPKPVNVSVQFDNELIKCYSLSNDLTVGDLKQLCFQDYKKEVEDSFNFGLFDVLDGQFLNEECVLAECNFGANDESLRPVLFKYKSRIYKKNELVPKAKQIKSLQCRTNEKKFLDAIHANNFEKLIKMATKGFDPNFHCHDQLANETPLSETTKLKSDITLSKLLTVLVVNCGALLDFRTRDGSTVLHRAVERNNYAAVKTLLDLGAAVNAKNAKQLTPMYLCAMLIAQKTLDLNIVKALLKHRARMGTTDTHGWHEIHQICRSGNAAVLELVLRYGNADLNAKNASGNTALHVCAVNGQDECAKLLLNYGCDADAYNYTNQTAYQVAIIANNLSFAEIIEKFRKNDTDSMKNIEGTSVRDMRTVELTRTAKGYGFSLRGIKNAENNQQLINGLDFPALQYLENIEKDSVAEAVGLKRGDFIYKINDINVSMEKHEVVVDLIRNSGDTVKLTVVTCGPHENLPAIFDNDTDITNDLNENGEFDQSRGYQSAVTLPRNRIRAPLPPRRNPKTSLSRLDNKRPPSVFLTTNEYNDYFADKIQEKFEKFSQSTTGSLPTNWSQVFAMLKNSMIDSKRDEDLAECPKLIHDGFHSDPELVKDGEQIDCNDNDDDDVVEQNGQVRRRQSDDDNLKSMFSSLIDGQFNDRLWRLNQNGRKLSCICDEKLKKLSPLQVEGLPKEVNLKLSKSFPANLSTSGGLNDDANNRDDNSSSGISSDQETIVVEVAKDSKPHSLYHHHHHQQQQQQQQQQQHLTFVPPPPQFIENNDFPSPVATLTAFVLEPPPQFCDSGA